MFENNEKTRIDEMIKNEKILRQGKMDNPVGNLDTNWYEMKDPDGSKYYVNNWSDDSVWGPPHRYYRYGEYADIPTKANSGSVFKYSTYTYTSGGYKKKYKFKYRNIKKSQKRTRTKNRRVKSRRY
jgi:hypothetical protein